MHTKLTKRVLESTIPPTDGSLFLRDTELTGFGARISSKGAITFFAEGRLRRGANKRVSLGRHPVVSVENARQKARETLYKLNLGIDPVKEDRQLRDDEHRSRARQKAQSVTLSQVIDDYFRSRPIKSEAGYRKCLQSTVPDWLDRPVRSITRQDVERRYRKLAFEEGHKAQAAKAMRCLSAILNFAKAELVEGQSLLDENPVDVLKDKKVDRTVKPRTNHIPKDKLGPVIQAILSECTETARDLLLFELLTGLRDTEAKTLRWSDVDFDRRIVTIPETKNGKPHVFGMGELVFAMLRHRHRHRGHETWVFPNRAGNGPLGSIRKQLSRTHQTANFCFTHHDLRRTFATLLSRELGVPSDIIGRLLNHSPKGVTERHYIQLDAASLAPLYDSFYTLIADATKELDLASRLYPDSSDSEKESLRPGE